MKPAKSSRTPNIFTTYDIGRMTGTDPTTVHKWIDKGLLRGYRTPGGHRRVQSDDLRAFLAAHKMPIPKELGGNATLRVLVVDSDVDEQRGLVRALKRLKPTWDVLTATSGVEGLLMVSANAPDVMLFDLVMPDVDGFSVCRQLQGRTETAAVKLVAMTARHSADTERKAIAAGAAACLRKPVSGADLVEAIELAAGLRPAA